MCYNWFIDCRCCLMKRDRVIGALCFICAIGFFISYYWGSKFKILNLGLCIILALIGILKFFGKKKK